MATRRARSAAGPAPDTFPKCTLPRIEDRPLSPDLHPERVQLIRMTEKKWVNGTEIRYWFFEQGATPSRAWVGPEAQRAVVRKAFQQWKSLGLGLEFSEVAQREDAEVRIGFMQRDGSWSYVGTDVLRYGRDPATRTMNFGWDLTTDYGWDTALHEIGHTLGYPHEHQNPNSGIVWDEPAVLQEFRGPPNNWDDDKIRWNILRKLPAAQVYGSDWDPDSIMHYSFPPKLILEPRRYYNAGLRPKAGLSSKDIAWAKQFYPALGRARETELKPFQSVPLTIDPGQQVNLAIRPTYTRTYTIQTLGRSDTVMVLFDRTEGEPRYVAGDDDSGTDLNAQLNLRLYRGREYVLRVRLYYVQARGETAVVLF